MKTNSDCIMRPCGLPNLGNTCYLNAVLQSLAALSALTALWPDKRSTQSLGDCLVAAIHEFFVSGEAAISQILALSGRIHTPFASYDQQDAHEYLRFLIEQTTTSSTPESREIADLFSLKLKSTITCESCEKVASIEEAALDLSLSIPGEPEKSSAWTSSRSASSVAVCVDFFEKTERLEHFLCDQCKLSTHAQKQMEITKLPEILTLHLKRFFHKDGGKGLLGWLSSWLGAGSGKNAKTVHFEETMVLKDVNYQLAAVIEHRGHMGGGHYVAFVKADRNWFLCDDARVTPVSWQKVRTAEAYLLFYQRQHLLLDLTPTDVLDGVYMSSRFLKRLRVLADPGPAAVVMLCADHGKIPSLTVNQADFITVSRALAQTLALKHPRSPSTLDRFKLVPFVESLETCALCKEVIHRCNRLRRLSRELVSQADTRELPVCERQWFLVDAAWVNSWRTYTDRLQSPQHLLEATEDAPGLLDNRRLLERLQTKQRLVQNVDFFAVNRIVWSLFCLLHGAEGPEITVASLSHLPAFRAAAVPGKDALLERIPESMRREIPLG